MVNRDVPNSLIWWGQRKWRKMKKEIMVAVWGAMIYHTWKARNWRIFRQIHVNTQFTITQIQEEVRDRLGVLQANKKVENVKDVLLKLGCG